MEAAVLREAAENENPVATKESIERTREILNLFSGESRASRKKLERLEADVRREAAENENLVATEESKARTASVIKMFN